MTLLTAGYWHTTYWAESYWQQDYWLEYGAAAPPTSEGGSKRYYRPPIQMRRRLSPQTLRLIRELLELELKEA